MLLLFLLLLLFEIDPGRAETSAPVIVAWGCNACCFLGRPQSPSFGDDSCRCDTLYPCPKDGLVEVEHPERVLESEFLSNTPGRGIDSLCVDSAWVYALTNLSEIFTWGNIYRRWGAPWEISNMRGSPIPVLYYRTPSGEEEKKIRELVCGESAIGIILEDGTALTAGADQYARLGQGWPEDDVIGSWDNVRFVPFLSPTNLTARISSIAIGTRGSVAITENFGKNISDGFLVLRSVGASTFYCELGAVSAHTKEWIDIHVDVSDVSEVGDPRLMSRFDKAYLVGKKGAIALVCNDSDINCVFEWTREWGACVSPRRLSDEFFGPDSDLEEGIDTHIVQFEWSSSTDPDNCFNYVITRSDQDTGRENRLYSWARSGCAHAVSEENALYSLGRDTDLSSPRPMELNSEEDGEYPISFSVSMHQEPNSLQMQGIVVLTNFGRLFATGSDLSGYGRFEGHLYPEDYTKTLLRIASSTLSSVASIPRFQFFGTFLLLKPYVCGGTRLTDVDVQATAVCSHHGHCVRDTGAIPDVGRCLCDADWSGTNCSDYSCFGRFSDDPLVCSTHGSCTTPDRCECSLRWFGPRCNNHSCNNRPSYDPQVCSGHGRCVSLEHCECDSRYTGMLCDAVIYNGTTDGYRPSKNLVVDVIAIVLSVLFLFVLFVAVICSAIISKIVRRRKNGYGRLLDDEKMELEDASSEIAILQDPRFKPFLEQLLADVEVLPNPLGQGGSKSTVFRGIQHTGGGIDVAVKTWLVTDTTTHRDWEECTRELEIMRSLAHPHIVKYLGTTVQKEVSHDRRSLLSDEERSMELVPKVQEFRVGIVMEYCECASLKRYVQRRNEQKTVLWKTKIKMLFQIASALAYFHGRKLIHRDVFVIDFFFGGDIYSPTDSRKPENVLVTGNDENFHCKLSDFGLALWDDMLGVQEGENMTQFVGTPGYIAPEVFRREFYDNSIDTYSFGILAYGLLTNSFRPYEDLLVEPRIADSRVANDPLFRPPIDRARFPRWLRKLVSECWHHDPAARPTMTDVQERLSRASDDDEDREPLRIRFRRKDTHAEVEVHLATRTMTSLRTALWNSSLGEAALTELRVVTNVMFFDGIDEICYNDQVAGLDTGATVTVDFGRECLSRPAFHMQRRKLSSLQATIRRQELRNKDLERSLQSLHKKS